MISNSRVLSCQRGTVRDLTPWHGVRNEFLASSPKFPDQILVTMNLRDRLDVYRINLRTGAI